LNNTGMSNLDSLPDVGIVIPLYNEEAAFDALRNRLQVVMDRMAPLKIEVVLVDDGSQDTTRLLLTQVCEVDARFRGVLLSRNFGHQVAISAGLQHVRGRYVAILDGDLQDPPEILPEFLEKLQSGYDIVYGVRRQRKEPAWKRAGYWLFYRLTHSLATVHVPLDAGDFCMMSDKVVRVINTMPERCRFLRGMRAWAGFRQTALPYERHARSAGNPKYTPGRLMRLALEGIFTTTEVPLRLATYLGIAVAGASFIWAAVIIFWRLFLDDSLPGYASLATGIFFLGGVQLICLGILGEYIARIHSEVKGRPLFVIDRLIGFGDSNKHDATVVGYAEPDLSESTIADDGFKKVE
jgi:glycosyltransferase involved in cell wall biosynthesis